MHDAAQVSALPLRIISASRFSKAEFWRQSALGISLQRLMKKQSQFLVDVVYENNAGLPQIYNRVIKQLRPDEHVVFIHDDVWIDDYFFIERVFEGLKYFDVIGVAGNKRRLAKQPAWAFVNTEFKLDERKFLSGAVAHGKMPFGEVSHFGPSASACELLDGVILGINVSAILSRGVFFDEQFDFDFYDMDFCRSARAADLTVGTWPIALTHQSEGKFGSERWQRAYLRYLAKWTD